MKNIISPKHVFTKYPGIDNIALNYQGKCSEVFKYPPNTSRDLIVFAYSKTKERRSLLNCMYSFENVVKSIKKNAPNAKILMMVFGDIPALAHSTFKKTWFVETYKYLLQHEGEYDRVVASDFRDVYWLNDFFRTIDSDEVIVMTECFSYKKGLKTGCFNAGHPQHLRQWMYRSAKDTNDVNKIIKMSVASINSGVIAGGFKHMLEFFKTWVAHSEQSKLGLWGYEQSLINILYYTGKMNHIPIVIEQCSQRMCFAPEIRNDNLNMGPDQKSITYRVDGCSPVLMHKGFPSSWENP
ncbi:Uncharacterized protein QTN25_007984 [Entamoeba marina]